MARCCSCCPIWNGRNTKKVVLLLVGLDDAGKTTAARNLAGGTTDDVIPTVGFTSIKLKHRGMNVNIFDLGGGSQIRGIWKSYFSDVHGVIFVVDASDASRIEECRHVLENLLRNERLAGKPVLVLANKQDKPGALDQVDLVESLRLEPLVNEQKCLTLIEECSAINSFQRNKTDSKLLNGYRWLVNQVANDYSTLNSRVEHDKKIDAEIFEARRNELRQRLEGAKDNGLETPYLNGDAKNLPYKNNIIHVSPPPGVIVSPIPTNEIVIERNYDENDVQSLTRHVKEQLERQSIKDRHKMSLVKKNKVLPVSTNNADIKFYEGRMERPRSEPNKYMLQDLIGSNSFKLDGKHTLPPIRARPASSKSLGHEGRAWDLHKELEVVNPLPNLFSSESSEVRDFNENNK